ncbi:hypothetical protein ACGFZA_31785 [Streptomyces sp. NPDC048211]|uniref:hypothetical protein n=1 Tax=Streptomyces sp. NPDC048211 TaxID=3365516 RepID=UPI00371F88FA
MAFGRRKNETTETATTPKPLGKLRTSMPTRLPATDPRTAGHETTYQSSRGGWFKPKN